MGSKKHKKHHKSERKEQVSEERIEKPLRLVLKVSSSGTASRGGTPSSEINNEMSSVSVKTEMPIPYHENDSASCSIEQPTEMEIPRPEKHKKSKKKKKKKSSEKEKEKKHKHHRHHHRHHHHKSEKKIAEHEEVKKFEPIKEEPIQEETPIITETEIIDNSVAQFPPAQEEVIKPISPPAPEPVPPSPPQSIPDKDDNSALYVVLTSLFKSLQKKDLDQFFAWPVSDVIAPGYSQIIQNPMDFSTMKEKLDKQLYSSVEDFKFDVKLMCENCMVYNHPDTVYHKAAKKLLHSAMKMMGKDKLTTLKRTLVAIEEPINEETPMDTTDSTIPQVAAEVPNDVPIVVPGIPPIVPEPVEVPEKAPPKKKAKSSSAEKSYDDLTPDEILQQAQEAAKCAADKLSFRHPNSDIGFLRQREDGSTSLSIVNPDGKKPNEREVNLGMLIGKLQSGTGTLNTFKEDPRNAAKPLKSVNYGSFSSFAPQYDSAFANLNKEETELVYSSYGDEIGVQYAESLINFAQDSDYVMRYVDSLLDTLTNGEHSKTATILEEKKRWKREKARMQAQERKRHAMNSPAENAIDKDSSDVQQKLDKTASLIQDLQQMQSERLSQKLPSHLSHVVAPSEKESKLAELVQDQLKELTQQALPQSVVGVSSVRKAMGIATPVNC